MPLDVIGAGLGRTGTTSLKFALEQLGFGPCHHMIEFIRHPETAGLWEQAADAPDAAIDWERVLAGYRATTDWPACYFYRQLAEHYPSAKVILTVRDPQSWFRSTQETIFSEAHLEATEHRPNAGFVRKAILGTFEGRMHDREHVIAIYEAHNAQVRRVISPERLLIYDVSQGWRPLCEFLGVPVPAARFPCANTTEDFRERRLWQPS